MRPARDQAEIDAALDLRERVFCGEQGVSRDADEDGLDDQALHVVAVEDGRVVGTCRLVFARGTARLGRLAVERALRGRGIGARILEVAEHEARGQDARLMRLHAQTAARQLYERSGYAPRGGVFVEEGIEHVTMEKRLA